MAQMNPDNIEDYEGATEGKKRLFSFLKEDKWLIEIMGLEKLIINAKGKSITLEKLNTQFIVKAFKIRPQAVHSEKTK
ncbi:MAG: hypothetical protein JW944_15455 [Deltaproteobacteria bacterium]|nr:hypothetical protein [Deltaproteobacteria bacterium]